MSSNRSIVSKQKSKFASILPAQLVFLNLNLTSFFFVVSGGYVPTVVGGGSINYPSGRVYGGSVIYGSPSYIGGKKKKSKKKSKKISAWLISFIYDK